MGTYLGLLSTIENVRKCSIMSWSRITKLFVVFIAICMMLVGCSESERLDGSEDVRRLKSAADSLKIDSSSLSSNIESTPDHVTLDLTSTLKIDSSVTIPNISSGKRYVAKKVRWNYEEVSSVFSIGEIVESKNASSFIGTERYIALGDGQLSFGELIFSQNNYQIALQYSPDINNGSVKLIKKDLAFMTSADAISSFSEVCENLGFMVEGEVEMISLDSETLNQEADKARESVPRDELSSVLLSDEDYYRVYSESDEVHILITSQQFEGVPFTKSSYTDSKSGMSYKGTFLRAYLRQAGIAEFYAGEIYEGFELLQEEENIVSLDVALDELATQDSSMLSEEVKTVYDIKLELVPRPNSSDSSTSIITLAWVFSCTTDSQDQVTTLFVDALDGESF
jgi:hypothetical protein